VSRSSSPDKNLSGDPEVVETTRSGLRRNDDMGRISTSNELKGGNAILISGEARVGESSCSRSPAASRHFKFKIPDSILAVRCPNPRVRARSRLKTAPTAHQPSPPGTGAALPSIPHRTSQSGRGRPSSTASYRCRFCKINLSSVTPRPEGSCGSPQV